jgi:plastocyanin
MMRTKRLGAFMACVVALVLLASACGGDGEGTKEGTSAPPTTEAPTSEATQTTSATPEETVVAQFDNLFDPAELTVASGDTITVQNKSGRTPHTFTIDEGDIDVTNDHGQSADVTIDLDPGTYPFYCSFHGTPTTGMHGTLTVE